MTLRRLDLVGWLVVATLAVGGLPASSAASPGVFVSKSEGPVESNSPVAVALRDGSTTVLTVSQEYRGPVGDFAFVLPIPEEVDEEDVHTVEARTIDHLRRQTRPKLVEWRQRDPCHPAKIVEPGSKKKRKVERGSTPAFEEGPYTVTVLDPDQADAVDRWLRRRDYEVPKAVASALTPSGKNDDYSFVVAEANSRSLSYEAGWAKPPPLRVQFRSSRLVLPLPGTSQRASGADDLLVFVLDRGSRFAVANTDNVAVPTRLPVESSVRNDFTTFYESLVDRLAADDGVTALTEYARDASKGGYFSIRDFATFGGEVAAGSSSKPGAKRRPSGPPSRSPGAQTPSGLGISRACLQKAMRKMQTKLRKQLQQQLSQQMGGGGSSGGSSSQFNAAQLRQTLSSAGLAKCIKRQKKSPKTQSANPGGRSNRTGRSAEKSVSDRVLEDGWVVSRLRIRLPDDPQTESLELTRAPAIGAPRRPPTDRWGDAGKDLDVHGEQHVDPDADPEGMTVGLPDYRVRFRILNHWPGEVACDSPNWDRWRAAELPTDPTPGSTGRRRASPDRAAADLGSRLDWRGLDPNVRQNFSSLIPGVSPPDDLDLEHPSTVTGGDEASE